MIHANTDRHDDYLAELASGEGMPEPQPRAHSSFRGAPAPR